MPRDRSQWARDNNERRRKNERNMRIMGMYRDGAQPTQIARALSETDGPITRQRVSKIIQRELDEARTERITLSASIADLELDRLTTIIRQAWLIVNRGCTECDGQGVYQNREVCDKCRGDGKFYVADTRMKAMKEIRNSIDQRARLLGLYAPEKLAITDSKGNDPDFSKEVSTMSFEEIDRALTDYDAGLRAGVEIAEAKKRARAGSE